MKGDEMAFLAALVVIVLLVFPMWGEGRGKHAGGIAMIAGSIIGWSAYLVLFRKRLRRRGELKRLLIASAVILVLVLGVGVAAALI